VTFTEIKHQVDDLPEAEQDKLAAYLTMLRNSRDPKYDEALLRRLSDTTPGQWISLDTLMAELSQDD
jgi:hypothetical protein